MDENLLPLLLLTGQGGSGSGSGAGIGSLLPLLLLGGGLGRGSSDCCSHTDSSGCDRTCDLAPTLAEQLKRLRGCRAKFALNTSTLWPGGQVIIARICEVEQDYVFIDRIEVSGVPSVDPSFFYLAISDIIGVQPIPRSQLLLESIFRLD